MYTLLLNKYNNLLQPKYRLQKLKVRSSSEIEITTLSAPKPYTRPLLFRFASIQHPFMCTFSCRLLRVSILFPSLQILRLQDTKV